MVFLSLKKKKLNSIYIYIYIWELAPATKTPLLFPRSSPNKKPEPCPLCFPPRKFLPLLTPSPFLPSIPSLAPESTALPSLANNPR